MLSIAITEAMPITIARAVKIVLTGLPLREARDVKIISESSKLH